jgi:putative flippase GtrA
MFEIGFKFLKFCVVGSLGLGIDFGTTFFLKEKVKINKYVSNSLGFIFATFSNYLLNKYWTFEDTDPDALIQFTKFVSVSIVGLGFSNLIIYLLINKKGVKFYWAKIIAIGVVVLWNFIANYNYTFSI